MHVQTPNQHGFDAETPFQFLPELLQHAASGGAITVGAQGARVLEGLELLFGQGPWQLDPRHPEAMSPRRNLCAEEGIFSGTRS